MSNQDAVSLKRENERLKKRIQELESQLNDFHKKDSQESLYSLAWKTLMSFEHAPFEIYLKDSDLKFRHLSVNTKRLFEVGKNELVGLTDSELEPLSSNDLQISLEEEKDLFHFGLPVIERFSEGQDSIGARSSMHVTKLPIFDGNKIVGLMGINHDISQLVQFQKEIAAERQLLNTVVDIIPDALYVKDAAGRYLTMNYNTAKKMGQSHPHELIGRTDFDYFPYSLAEKYRQDEIEVMAGSQRVNYEEPSIDLRTGEATTLLTTKVPFIDANTDEVLGIVGISKDVTTISKIADFGKEFLSFHSLQELLHNLVQITRDMFQADLVNLIISDENFSGTATTFPDGEICDLDKRENGLTKKILENVEPVVISNLDQQKRDPYPMPQSLRGEINTIIGIPMATPSAHEAVGVMWLHFKDEVGDTSELVRHLSSLLNQAAVAYGNLSIVLNLESGQQNFVKILSKAALGNNENTLRAILETTKTTFNCQSVILYLHEALGDDGKFISIMNQTSVNEDEGKLDLSQDESFLRKLMSATKIQIITDTSKHVDFSPNKRRFVREGGVKSCLIFPLSVGEAKLGTIFVNYESIKNFSSKYIVEKSYFINEMAIAIYFGHLNSERKQMYINLAHEINLPIVGMLSASEIIRFLAKEIGHEELIAFSEENFNNAQRTSLVVDTMLKIFRQPEVTRPIYKRYSLLRPIMEAVELFDFEAKNKNCEIRVHHPEDGFPEIMMSFHELSLVFKNIIGNAVKYSYSKDGGSIDVKGKWFDDKKTSFTVTVENAGVGITKDEIESRKIFDLYYRGQNAIVGHRTGGGIGLAFALQAVEQLHNGRIDVSSTQLESGDSLTKFEITLPVMQDKIYIQSGNT